MLMLMITLTRSRHAASTDETVISTIEETSTSGTDDRHVAASLRSNSGFVGAACMASRLASQIFKYSTYFLHSHHSSYLVYLHFAEFRQIFMCKMFKQTVQVCEIVWSVFIFIYII